MGSTRPVSDGFLPQGLPGAYGQKGVSGAKVKAAHSQLLADIWTVAVVCSHKLFSKLRHLLVSRESRALRALLGWMDLRANRRVHAAVIK